MATALEEHDALIIAAARGILRRVEHELYHDFTVTDPAAAMNIGRAVESCNGAADAITNALIGLKVFADSVHAAGVLHRDEGRRPVPVEVPE